MDVRVLEAAVDPVAVFREWLEEAEASEPNDANAAALATAAPDGSPSVRMVLVKQVDARGFCFYTNARSRKGRELAGNPRAALCFHWKSLRRQVRVEGPVVELPGEDADAYFHSRERESQLGSAVSQQSRPLENREALERMVAEFAALHPGEVPRPEWWRGYAVRPERVELWVSGEHRLHDRFLFVREGNGWVKTRLFP
ncbi:pyridoxamine 5'-phosphate oxidase [Edaphobacter aggregans]|uniref:pyridoxamine 5'-phosphate oxidase n=1 Tax=Edaphobacter aggregans TaxID=570835 RepID=UPI000554539D|nr:pyridoxamine 5'-phosphate oxidase [Edaphobacter aggregans]